MSRVMSWTCSGDVRKAFAIPLAWSEGTSTRATAYPRAVNCDYERARKFTPGVTVPPLSLNAPVPLPPTSSTTVPTGRAGTSSIRRSVTPVRVPRLTTLRAGTASVRLGPPAVVGVARDVSAEAGSAGVVTAATVGTGAAGAPGPHATADAAIARAAKRTGARIRTLIACRVTSVARGYR